MKRYNLINNALGWLCFVIAAVTYLLTLEPTASFWDCPEFILQGYKLEVGHPPGNPIFMLAARFFINFVGGDVTKVAIAVNAMSALLSAGTILLLFWTVTHLVRRLIVKDGAEEISMVRMLVIMGSGLCGALVYTWSDTFWFSAVEGEVYAFSSFCTALVFWLILKWQNRCDNPSSDKYLILIAYVIGISIAVHLLNLLCIPAIVLVIYYTKWKNTNLVGSLAALGVSVVIVALILYGLVPGFIEIAQYFEMFCVNTLGWGYNMGVLVYAILLVASFVWAVSSIYRWRSMRSVRFSILVSTLLSGIFFIGDSLFIPLILTIGLALWLFLTKKLPRRVLAVSMISILVIFIGYSSYALLLIRSTANPPMNQNAPDNVFALAGYLNREQYGDRPLLYGQTFESGIVYVYDNGNLIPLDKGGKKEYSKVVKDDPSEPDRYVMTGEKTDYVNTPELNMLFPRMYSGAHAGAYRDWTNMKGYPVDGTYVVDTNGEVMRRRTATKPTMLENLRFFLTYQLNHMYWRYFLWNFAGRQNDIQGNGEVNHGNWISGIPFIDNPRLGDQSLLPYDEGEGNKGHNVFYMLPLLMGILGLLWQAFRSQRGIEQFWVICFLFLMTGVAIVVYLNQTPTQPRERDYAFAGSFYAFSIWVGMGVAGLWATLRSLLAETPKGAKKGEKKLPTDDNRKSLYAAIAAVVVGILVPIQMVSQTWDDHDRSGRYAARDFGMNYLNSLDENAIIFTNGDNDTFPLWYAQEVEGVRTDVKVVNQSYLTTAWYIDRMRQPSYEAEGIAMLAPPSAYAYDKMQFSYFADPSESDTTAVDALAALGRLYSSESRRNTWGVPMLTTPKIFIPVDIEKAVRDGRLSAEEAAVANEAIVTDLYATSPRKDGLTIGNVITLDMLANSMKNGWNRPIYFAMTVPEEYYVGLTPWMRSTGMAYEITPVLSELGPQGEIRVDTDRAYRNVTEKYRWGGLDTAPVGSLYLDETIRRMVTTTRTSMIDLANALLDEGYAAKKEADSIPSNTAAAERAADRFAKARTILTLMEEKLPEGTSPYSIQIPQQLALLYHDLGNATGNEADKEHARELLRREILKYGRNIRYYESLRPDLYNTLQRTDLYIHRVYIPTLLQYYMSMGGDANGVAAELQAMGVDVERLLDYYSRMQ